MDIDPKDYSDLVSRMEPHEDVQFAMVDYRQAARSIILTFSRRSGHELGIARASEGEITVRSSLEPWTDPIRLEAECILDALREFDGWSWSTISPGERGRFDYGLHNPELDIWVYGKFSNGCGWGSFTAFEYPDVKRRDRSQMLTTLTRHFSPQDVVAILMMRERESRG